MRDAELTVVTSFIDALSKLLIRLVWPLLIVYVLRQPRFTEVFTLLIERFSQGGKFRVGRIVVELPAQAVKKLPAHEDEKPPTPFRRPPRTPKSPNP
jgi:hypothetical protein